MGAVILDASVLIGLLDTADAHHERAYSETLVAFARARRLGDARASIAAMGIQIAPLTAAMAERAAELRAGRRRLRLPDAMLVACALEIGGELLTYDDRLPSVADAG
jgi:predicted nucleic acid-binding protein